MLQNLFASSACLLSLLAHATPAGMPRQAGPAEGVLREITITGLSRPSREVELAFASAGVLSMRSGHVAERVSANTLLAELESAVERSLVQKHKIQLASADELRLARLESELKREELERLRRIAETNATSSWELRQAEFAHKLAEARVAAEQTEHDLTCEELLAAEAVVQRRQIRAPFNGTIARILCDTGQAVDALEPVLVLVQLDPLWIEVNVPSEWAGRVRPGHRARIEGLGSPCTAEVCEIEPLVDSGSLTFRVRLAIPNPERTLTAGLPVRVTMEVVGASPETDLSQQTTRAGQQ